MSYLHGSSFQQAKAELQENGVCYSNAVLDGTEYFYSLKQMKNAAWTWRFWFRQMMSPPTRKSW